MVMDAETPVTQEEIDAAKAELIGNKTAEELAAEYGTKNVAVLTVMMPPVLREMINEAAGEDGSAATWARELFARELGYTLPAAAEKPKAARNKRDIELKQKAQRQVVADLIAKAKRGEISL